MKLWLNHACLNLGSSIRCVWHMVIPPQFDHCAHDIESLANSNPLREFLRGLFG